VVSSAVASDGVAMTRAESPLPACSRLLRSPRVLIRFSRRGVEHTWSKTLYGSSSATAELEELVEHFARRSTGVASGSSPGKETSSSSSSSAVPVSSVRLYGLPAKIGEHRLALLPSSVEGSQSLASFLASRCLQDAGAYQLRAHFDQSSDVSFVLVRVSFPGMAPDSEAEFVPEEQFECVTSSSVAALKAMISRRTKFPTARMVLLQGHRRLPDARRISDVAAVGQGLQLHLAAEGVCIFLRREGQWHRQPCGPCRLTLRLPACVHGCRKRQLAFDPACSFNDFLLSVQAVSGLPVASICVALLGDGASPAMKAENSQQVQDLGIIDGCTLEVHVKRDGEGVAAQSVEENELVMVDASCASDAAALYASAAKALGLEEASRLALFHAGESIARNGELSCVCLVDGLILSAYTAFPLQLSYSVLRPVAVFAEESASKDSSPAPLIVGAALNNISCLSSDTIAEVRERVIGASGSSGTDVTRLRSCRVFSADKTSWLPAAAESTSLRSLARAFHLQFCSDNARLSTLGIADSEGHIVLVPEQHMLVEVRVFVAGEERGLHKFRVLSTTNLAELSDHVRSTVKTSNPVVIGQCEWALANVQDDPEASANRNKENDEGRAGSPANSAISQHDWNPFSPVNNKRRRSLSWRKSDGKEQDTDEKRRRLGLEELPSDDVVGDLCEQHPARRCRRVTAGFACPISYEMMRDPVLVVGSGNTYDRKSIERHFGCRKSDPLTNQELRKAEERRLVPNNLLRSQIEEFERAQVDLRLVAFCTEGRRQGHADASWTRLADHFRANLNFFRRSHLEPCSS